MGCRSGQPDARDLSGTIAREGIFAIGEAEESFCCRNTGELICVNYSNSFVANLIFKTINTPSRQKGESNEQTAASPMP
jgi:hypothetical protein